MIKYWLSALLYLIAIHVDASTFVGNGGNAGDLDLAITLAEIHDTFENLDEKSLSLCRCPDELAENEICGVLRSLNEAQDQFCKEMMLKNKDVLTALASKESRIKFTWIDEPLSALSEEGEARIVDAVTQSKNLEIILSRRRFLEMPQSFRIALIAHELFHLVPFAGNYMNDNHAVGPFKDGKSLLDTLGAATAITANDSGIISDFAHLEKVSRAYKKLVLQLDFKSIAHTDDVAQKLLKARTSYGTAFTFEYKPENIGFRLGIDSVTNTSKYLNAISVEESLALFSFGLGYHWFPVKARLSRWSETHVSCFVDALLGTARYRVEDEAMSLEDKGRVLGAQVTGQLHIPMVMGFWGTLGYQAKYLKYSYKDLGININELQHIVFLGGAYGF